MEPILVAGAWRASHSKQSFTAENPATMQALPEQYPISDAHDLEQVLAASDEAAKALGTVAPAKLAAFLEDFAARIESATDALCTLAHLETGLPITPRLHDVELPRTVNQLRQAAAAAREGSWALPTIDVKANIRSVLGPLGPVWVYGPNNFPFAYNGVAGGDFASAIAAGNPVVAKANPGHPGTTKLLAELAFAAVQNTGLPPATVQMIYAMDYADGERIIADPRLAAIGFTGSRSGGLALKRVADEHGKPAYLELSSINPVVILPGALQERGATLVDEYVGSCTAGAGQFCTNPGLVVLLSGKESEVFVQGVVNKFKAGTPGTLLTKRVQDGLVSAVKALTDAGAKLLCGGTAGGGKGYSFAHTLLTIDGTSFLKHPAALQTEAFGNVGLVVEAETIEQLCEILNSLEGNLTGSIYSHGGTGDEDECFSALVEPILRRKVGRLLNDKMPTGVAVSSAMNHGGPFPATGHPGVTAVGFPASIRRFAALHCYDAVRKSRLPASLKDQNPTGKTWRLIDGEWTTRDVS